MKRANIQLQNTFSHIVMTIGYTFSPAMNKSCIFWFSCIVIFICTREENLLFHSNNNCHYQENFLYRVHHSTTWTDELESAKSGSMVFKLNGLSIFCCKLKVFFSDLYLEIQLFNLVSIIMQWSVVDLFALQEI